MADPAGVWAAHRPRGFLDTTVLSPDSELSLLLTIFRTTDWPWEREGASLHLRGLGGVGQIVFLPDSGLETQPLLTDQTLSRCALWRPP